MRRVAEQIDALQQQGQYTFATQQLQTALGISSSQMHQALRGLRQKSRIAKIRRDFFVITPIEYRSAGAPPPAWFIDQYMRFLDCPYYVGLLSAAELHGASHQSPQVFQVICARQQPARNVGRSVLRFFVRQDLSRIPIEQRNTETGQMPVSTPEMTALDLVHYAHVAGGLASVQLVIAELAGKLNSKALANSAEILGEAATAQRLGFILEQVGAKRCITDLQRWVKRRNPPYTALVRRGSVKGMPRNDSWRLYLNYHFEEC